MIVGEVSTCEDSWFSELGELAKNCPVGEMDNLRLVAHPDLKTDIDQLPKVIPCVLHIPDGANAKSSVRAIFINSIQKRVKVEYSSSVPMLMMRMEIK